MKANIYFVGAGGIGMAALERYFLSKGRKVAGYDRTPSELTDALEKEGVEITFTDDVATIPDAFRDRQTPWWCTPRRYMTTTISCHGSVPMASRL